MTGRREVQGHESLEKALRDAGAKFAYVFGSRATGTAREDSDVDVAAWFGRKGVDPLDVRGVDFDNVDLVVLDDAPLHLAGRIAIEGMILFEDDEVQRVRWEATTRRIWSSERPRYERAWQDFKESLKRDGRR